MKTLIEQLREVIDSHGALDPAVETLLDELRRSLPELPALRMWRVGSIEDGYFAGIVMAATEKEARSLAWAYYTKWTRPGTEYHNSADELSIEDIGNEIWFRWRGKSRGGLVL